MHFLLNFEQITCDIAARNPSFVLVTGDFNARTANCWRNNMTTSEGTKTDSL